jgi:hypothetical protein
MANMPQKEKIKENKHASIQQNQSDVNFLLLEDMMW